MIPGGRDSCKALLVAVRCGVLLGSIVPMLFGVGLVSVSDMGVVGCFLMIAGFVMLCRLSMVMCSLRVVVGSLLVMLCCFR